MSTNRPMSLLAMRCEARDRHQAAAKRYNVAVNMEAYRAATKGKSLSYCNVLIDDAMALCGSPFHALSKRFLAESYSAEAARFLSGFAEHPASADAQTTKATCALIDLQTCMTDGMNRSDPDSATWKACSYVLTAINATLHKMGKPELARID